jgi:hypothetical protein
MAHRADISRFLLKPDKCCIIAEYGLCYYINNYILSLQAEMDGKLALTEKELPASYAYDYADREKLLNEEYVSGV